MDAPASGRTPESPAGAEDDCVDAGLVVYVLHRVGRCSLRSLGAQPELDTWSPERLEKAVVRAWNGGLVFIDRNDDLVAL